MKDVVCGMDVEEGSNFSSEYNGIKYYFCSISCKEKFDKNPSKFSKKR